MLKVNVFIAICTESWVSRGRYHGVSPVNHNNYEIFFNKARNCNKNVKVTGYKERKPMITAKIDGFENILSSFSFEVRRRS